MAKSKAIVKIGSIQQRILLIRGEKVITLLFEAIKQLVEPKTPPKKRRIEFQAK